MPCISLSFSIIQIFFSQNVHSGPFCPALSLPLLLFYMVVKASLLLPTLSATLFLQQMLYKADLHFRQQSSAHGDHHHQTPVMLPLALLMNDSPSSSKCFGPWHAAKPPTETPSQFWSDCTSQCNPCCRQMLKLG